MKKIQLKTDKEKDIIKTIIDELDEPSYNQILDYGARDYHSFKKGVNYGINYIMEQLKDKL